mmetsp:Transcript_28767/g.85941  ORF Transcript_28767/g.85941 Transcript_28767/m.85941 type:complete len:365 (+) Transcript_28767:156-1250(+)
MPALFVRRGVVRVALLLTATAALRRHSVSTPLRVARGGARDDAGYYAALGVPRDATTAQINRAFRKKSLACHPDKGGDPEAFKKLNEAKDVLANAETRAFYDRHGTADMQQGPPGGAPGFNFGNTDARTAQMFEQMFGSFGSAFGDAFGGAFGGGFQRPRRFALTVKLDDCFSGRTLSVALDGGERCRVRLEPGAADGDVVRAQTRDGATATFELREAPHSVYARRGADLLLDARVPLAEALGGGPTITVARPDGTQFRIKLAGRGQVLKHGHLRCVEGEGMPVRGGGGKRGRLFLRILVEFPDELDMDEGQRAQLGDLLGVPRRREEGSDAPAKAARSATAAEWNRQKPRQQQPPPGFGFAFQ